MKMDAEANKDVLGEMLKTLKSDMDWDPEDPYEAVCLAGGLVRYHFAFARSAVETALEQVQKESTTIQSDSLKVSPMTAMGIADGDPVNLQVKAEHPEEAQVAEKCKELSKLEREVGSSVTLLKKTKALLLACQKSEGRHVPVGLALLGVCVW